MRNFCFEVLHCEAWTYTNLPFFGTLQKVWCSEGKPRLLHHPSYHDKEESSMNCITDEKKKKKREFGTIGTKSHSSTYHTHLPNAQREEERRHTTKGLSCDTEKLI